MKVDEIIFVSPENQIIDQEVTTSIIKTPTRIDNMFIGKNITSDMIIDKNLFIVNDTVIPDYNSKTQMIERKLIFKGDYVQKIYIIHGIDLEIIRQNKIDEIKQIAYEKIIANKEEWRQRNDLAVILEKVVDSMIADGSLLEDQEIIDIRSDWDEIKTIRSIQKGIEDQIQTENDPGVISIIEWPN